LSRREDRDERQHENAEESKENSHVHGPATAFGGTFLQECAF
jgi:hypothetical protein